MTALDTQMDQPLNNLEQQSLNQPLVNMASSDTNSAYFSAKGNNNNDASAFNEPGFINFKSPYEQSGGSNNFRHRTEGHGSHCGGHHQGDEPTASAPQPDSNSQPGSGAQPDSTALSGSSNPSQVLQQLEQTLIQTSELLVADISELQTILAGGGSVPSPGGDMSPNPATTTSLGGDTSPNPTMTTTPAGDLSANQTTTTSPGGDTSPNPTTSSSPGGDSSANQITTTSPGGDSSPNPATTTSTVSDSSSAPSTIPSTDTGTGSDTTPATGTAANGGITPTWANDTAIDNNNGGLVSPSFFAQPLAANTTYSPANLNFQFSGNAGDSWDEGVMIDERGMSPSQLETIPEYQGVSSFTSNASTGQQIGTLEIPKGFTLPRNIGTLSDGEQYSVNSVVTIIQPDGEEDNFAKTFIGSQPDVDNGNTALVGAPVGHTAWFGNEGAVTTQEASLALNDGIGPNHALDFNVPLDVLSSADDGKAFPALYADGGYANDEYTGSNPLLRMGTELAIPKDVTAQSLGLQTDMGKALLWTMENYGGYVADTIPSTTNGGIDSTVGVAAMIQNSGQESAVDSDIDKIIAAAQVANGT